MLGVMCLVALLRLVRSFLLVLSVLVFSAYRLCVLTCAVCLLLVDWRCFANVLWYCGTKLVSYSSTIAMIHGPVYIRYFTVVWILPCGCGDGVYIIVLLEKFLFSARIFDRLKFRTRSLRCAWDVKWGFENGPFFQKLNHYQIVLPPSLDELHQDWSCLHQWSLYLMVSVHAFRHCLERVSWLILPLWRLWTHVGVIPYR